MQALKLLEREPNSTSIQEAANFKPSRCLEWLLESSVAATTAQEPQGSTSSKEQQSSGSGSGNNSDADADADDDGNQQQHEDADKRQSAPVAKFKVFDLIAGKYLFDESTALGAEEELQLPVSPSGVRALRVEAL